MEQSRDGASARAFLEGLFHTAIAAAHPSVCLPAHLPQPTSGRVFVLAAGKAAGSMTEVAERHYLDEVGLAPNRLPGLAVTRHGYGRPTRMIEMLEAGHPVPDAAGLAAAERTLELAAQAVSDDLVLVLLSGGASANWIAPAPGVGFADKQAVTRALLRCGATIGEINAVRKHLSAIKGGRLAAAAAPARVVTLAISDVPGDDPAIIGSGPTVADPTRFADARAVLAKYGIDEPAAVLAHLAAAADETPKPGDPIFARTSFALVASPLQALAAAADAASARGIAPVVLSDRIEGEARDVAAVHAAIALQISAGRFRVGDRVVSPPAVLLSGGETTVSVRGNGRGGRNSEFLLALAAHLDGAPGIAALACDTDGIDGTEDNAGAIVYPDTIARAASRGILIKEALLQNDGYGFFAALGDLVVTGPTLTNVNDFRAILVLPSC